MAGIARANDKCGEDGGLFSQSVKKDEDIKFRGLEDLPNQYGVDYLPRPSLSNFYERVPYVRGAVPPSTSRQVSIYMHKNLYKSWGTIGKNLKDSL